jgi:hypothetical protein
MLFSGLIYFLFFSFFVITLLFAELFYLAFWCCLDKNYECYYYCCCFAVVAAAVVAAAVVGVAVVVIGAVFLLLLLLL